jgi:hypothetical protein
MYAVTGSSSISHVFMLFRVHALLMLYVDTLHQLQHQVVLLVSTVH